MTVADWGTGRKDYSQNVEYLVEPLIRSWESEYIYTEQYADVEAGSSATVDIDIDADTVVLLYDFTLSARQNVLLGFEIYAIGTDGTVATVFRDRNYQLIYHPIPRGFPFFKTIRATYENLGNVDADLVLGFAGIVTGEHEYYLRITG